MENQSQRSARQILAGNPASSVENRAYVAELAKIWGRPSKAGYKYHHYQSTARNFQKALAYDGYKWFVVYTKPVHLKRDCLKWVPEEIARNGFDPLTWMEEMTGYTMYAVPYK